MLIQQPQSREKKQTMRRAGLRLLDTYADLARTNKHLLSDVLSGQMPVQWAHYPMDDAIDEKSGYQWFYHTHGTEDRRVDHAHGHIHLFAKRSLWSRRLQSKHEKAFQMLCGSTPLLANTCHLLAIGFDAKGLPVSLFTVNRWVTGDALLSRQLTLNLLQKMQINSGYLHVDAVITSVIQLCFDEITALMTMRDKSLADCKAPDPLNEQQLEILSETQIDLDEKMVF